MVSWCWLAAYGYGWRTGEHKAIWTAPMRVTIHLELDLLLWRMGMMVPKQANKHKTCTIECCCVSMVEALDARPPRYILKYLN